MITRDVSPVTEKIENAENLKSLTVVCIYVCP